MQAPRLHPIDLPRETYPFSLHPSLSHLTSLSIDLANSVLRAQSLSPEEAGQAATLPHTRRLRIVHPSLIEAIIVIPSSTAIVSVSDVLTAVHTVLQRPLSTRDIPSHRRADVLSYVQAKSSKRFKGKEAGGVAALKVVDLLEGASLFRGLQMDVVQSNRMLGVIDELQALTWILLTCEHASTSSSSSSYGAPLTPVSLGHAPLASVAYSYDQMASYGYMSSQPPQQQSYHQQQQHQHQQYHPQQQHPVVYLATGQTGYYC